MQKSPLRISRSSDLDYGYSRLWVFNTVVSSSFCSLFLRFLLYILLIINLLRKKSPNEDYEIRKSVVSDPGTREET